MSCRPPLGFADKQDISRCKAGDKLDNKHGQDG
jgi:hypothetical protein